MDKNMLTIIKKEFARFFGDKRMIFTTILMPGILIYTMYSFIGSAMSNEFATKEDYVAAAYVQNLPGEFQEIFSSLSAKWTNVDAAGAEEAKEKLRNKEADVLVVFPEHFLQDAAAYDVTSGGPAPAVEIYYNSVESESAKIYNIIWSILDSYEASMTNRFDVNPGDEAYDLADEKDITGQIFSMMLPMLLIMLSFSGCMAVAPESIAGEKERGTIATLLVTPMKRSSLALGKIISLSCIALLSGSSSFLGIMLSLPKLTGGAETEMNAGVYGVSDYLLLLGIILTTVLVFVAAISVISACAKSVKEASTAVSPLMILVTVISLIPMFSSDTAENPAYFLIPVYNSVQCMHGIFAFHYEPVQMIVTMAANIVCTGALTFMLARLFSSEKVMFNK